MAFQPDMLLEFAHYLEQQYRQQGYSDVEVRAEVYVSLNGRPARLLVDPTVDLTQQHNSLAPKLWVLAGDT
ncbi:MAG: HTTM domain-containing protein [Chloroflexaceae bacterium]|nr:HTTM domain-containing protein [Chloroflexaceae bacterium]